MCLRTKDPTFYTAKRNILVFKKGLILSKGFIARHRNYVYRRFQRSPLVLLKPMNPYTHSKDVYEVDEGYHSFNSPFNKHVDFRSNALFIIPKGVSYVKGTFSTFNVKNRVSTQIVYIGKLWNPINWIRALTFKIKS
jgi:hypothetical protein